MSGVDTGSDSPTGTAETPLDVGRHVLPDGRGLEVATGGAGSDTVVFEAGMGGGLHSWDLVTRRVADEARVVAYSRAGYGASDPDPRTLDVTRAGGDLLALLDTEDIERAVLVGHSYGGPIIRQVLADAPERVAGLVLVDVTDEGCAMFFDRDSQRTSAIFAKLAPVLGALGLSRTLAKKTAAAAPPDVQRLVVEESGSREAFRTFARELATYVADLERLRDDPLPPIDVPLTVISAGQVEKGRKGAERRAAVRAAHERRAAEAADGRFVLADGSSHLVPFDDPQLVADEVLRLIRRG